MNHIKSFLVCAYSLCKTVANRQHVFEFIIGITLY